MANPLKSGIARGVLDEFGETLKQTASQASKIPGDVVKGALGQAKKEPAGEIGTDEKGAGGKSDKQVQDPKQIQQQQILAQKKAQDQKLSKKKYDEIQAQIREIRLKREEEYQKGLTKHITGKPGEAETLEEKQDIIEKQRKEAEEAKKKEKVLPPSAKAGRGTVETVRPVSG